MKRVIVLLAVVIILTGGMETTAATADTCKHQYLRRENVRVSTETYTHAVQVGISASGKPILAACLAEIKWQHYKYVCNECGTVIINEKEKIYEIHSMH